MKKAITILVALALFTTGFACAPAVGANAPLATPTPVVSPQSEIEQANSPEAQQALISQYQQEADFQRVYDAARKLSQLDPKTQTRISPRRVHY